MERFENVLYVAGIDTEIGKTYATAFLIDYFRKQGKNAFSQKMVQTGCETYAEDIETHRRLNHEPMRAEDLNGESCAYLFPFPASPHLSARMQGVEIDEKRIDQCTENLLRKGFSPLLVECAGGLMVPLNENYLTIDYIAERQGRVALVTSGRLGSINHTLLSLEACQRRGIRVNYLLYNEYPPADPQIDTETRGYLARYYAEHHPGGKLLMLPYLHE